MLLKQVNNVTELTAVTKFVSLCQLKPLVELKGDPATERTDVAIA